MSEFTPISRPDHKLYAGEAFEPFPESYNLIMCPPRPGLFTEESRYWDERCQTSLAIVEDTSDSTENLRDQARSLRRFFIEFDTLSTKEFTSEDAHGFTTVTALLGISKYLRQDPAFDFKVPQHNIINLNPTRPWRYSLHLPLADLQHRDLVRPSEDQPEYYESEDLFIQVTTPALVSEDETDYFLGAERGQSYMLLPEEFATVVARPKWQTWAGFDVAKEIPNF